MSLVDLPEEILIIIIKELDFMTIHSLYNSCKHLKRIVGVSRVIRECHLSLSTLATVHTLKSDFFKDISIHLVELNMCGIPDLRKSIVLPAMKNLKSLITLDISFTNINMLDFLEMYQVCPTVKNICINFIFGKPGIVCKISQKTMLQCQKVFKNLVNVHFVGSLTNLLYSNFALCILQYAKLHTLEYTLAECNFETMTDKIDINCDVLPVFNAFYAYLVNWRHPNPSHGYLSNICLLKLLIPTDYEFILILMANIHTYTVYASDLFKDFFKDNFGVNSEGIDNFQNALKGNVALLVWNNITTNFDSAFFDKLREQMKQYFPSYLCPCSGNMASTKFDWFYTIPMVREVVKYAEYQHVPGTQKIRRVLPNYYLRYDPTFKEITELQLSLVFKSQLSNAVTLSTSSNYLRKLTYLSLSGTVKYSMEFFNILFKCCTNLVTVNVEAPPISPCSLDVCRWVPLSLCLKNFRFVDKKIDFNKLFIALSQCKTLENVYIQDSSTDPGDPGDPSKVIDKCDNLYNIFIEAPMSQATRTKRLRQLNKAKTIQGKHHLTIELHALPCNDTLRYHYLPTFRVFKINPIKPL